MKKPKSIKRAEPDLAAAGEEIIHRYACRYHLLAIRDHLQALAKIVEAIADRSK